MNSYLFIANLFHVNIIFSNIAWQIVETATMKGSTRNWRYGNTNGGAFYFGAHVVVRLNKILSHFVCHYVNFRDCLEL